MHIFTYFFYVSLCPCHGQTAAIYLWRITSHSSFPTAAAGHPVIKFTRALESELSRRLPGNITVSGCKCTGCTGCMHPPLRGRTLVCAAGSVRHRLMGRAESVPCQRPTTARHRQNKSNPASLPLEPPSLSLYQSQMCPQSESSTGGHAARTGHYCGALQSAGRPPHSVDRPQPRRFSSPPLSFSSRPGWPNRRIGGGGGGLKRPPWISWNAWTPPRF